MSSKDDDLAKEIVIVKRRRSSGDEGHHGGAWKIAYADFMTAMMAFFLVMWLVNMTDDKTIVQIANYFNPLQLTDRNPTEKGLYDSHYRESKVDAEGSESDKKVHSPGQARAEKARKEKDGAQEAKLFVDPQKTLEGVTNAGNEASPEHGTEDQIVGLEEDGTSAELHEDGLAISDPFDPSMGNSRSPPVPQDNLVAQDTTDSRRREQAMLPADASRSSEKAVDGVAGDERTAAAASIQNSIQKAVEGLRHAAPDVSVQVTAEGVLVSMMDSKSFEMFKLSSAEPMPETVKLIDRIGLIILETKKKIVIRGHTDAKQFKRSSYDNWRLSTARAHMAHYMLRRTGIKDDQIEKIEGFAESQLRNQQNPFAAENRRIEFLLRVGS